MTSPSFIPTTHVNVAPSTTGSWQTVSLSAYIPDSATGVALHYVNGGTTDRECGWRKTGSADDFTRSLRNACQCQGFVGIDGSRQVDIQIGHADIAVYLVGYFGSEWVFLTDAVTIVIGSSGGFTDGDISGTTGADTAIAAVLQHLNSSNQTIGLRKNGSTDSRLLNGELSGAIVGVDGSEIFEYDTSAASELYLLGYLKNTALDATFYTNALDRSLGSTGAYADLTALPANSVGGVYEIINGAGGDQWSLRKKGATEDYYKNANLRHNWHVVACDNSQLVEGKIAATSADFFETAYFTGAFATVAWIRA